MTTTTVETRISVCDSCREAITISVVVGEQKWQDVEWRHVASDGSHKPVAELRFAVDATCRHCKYPELGFSPATEQFMCSRCGHTTTTRPKD